MFIDKKAKWLCEKLQLRTEDLFKDENTLISELEWRVLPALMLDQAKLYLKDDAPIAFVSWARLSEAAAQRYRTAPHQLIMTDWTSGDQIWLIDVLTPFGGAQDVLRDLREKVFAGQVIQQIQNQDCAYRLRARKEFFVNPRADW